MSGTPKPVGPPLFTSEGPDFYDAAYRHNSPFATGGPYQTVLSGPDEATFRLWADYVNAIAGGPLIKPDLWPNDYDDRGYWVAQPGHDASHPTYAVGQHGPDTWKTPYDTSFSKQSQYATATCPFDWVTDRKWGDLLLDFRNGQIVFGPKGAGVNGNGGPPRGVTYPQQLTDQMEGLGPDVDIESLSLVFEGKTGFALREMITGGDITRTIEGASTLSLDVFDRDRALVTSGLLGADVDVLIDTLWFRLVAPAKQGDSVSLVFEDREVAILRDYPDRDNLKTWPFLRSVDKLPPPPQGRAVFAQMLVKQAAAASGSPIRFVCPALPSPEEWPKRVKREPGLPPPGQFVRITVQNEPATREQLAVITDVIEAGQAMHVDGLLLIASIMTITAESDARNLSGGDRDSVGAFQQRPTGGRPDGKGYWPASRNVKTDATAFFEVALYMRDKFEHGDPPAPLTVTNLAAFCSEVQRDASWGTDHQGSPYAPWLVEATETVSKYLGGQDPIAPPKSKQADKDVADEQGFRGDHTLDTARHFYRGKPKKPPPWDREDNWACLNRLADEVRWRCFVVSGTVYFISEPDLFRSQPAMVISERSDGIDAIDWRYDVGQHNAQVTVTARASRWQAPPGTVVVLEDSGPVDGRWIVSTIRRPIFDTSAQITLKKPRPVLPESRAPEYGTDAASGTTDLPKKPKPRQPKPPQPLPPGGFAGYKDPFRLAADLYAARIDMGVDYASPAPDSIYPLGSAKIDYVSDAWLGNPSWKCIGYTLLDGPAAGKSVYLAEYIVSTKTWVAGVDYVDAGTIIANFVPGTDFNGNGIEIGWAVPGTGQPVASSQYQIHGYATAYGENFSQLLASLNPRNGGRYENGSSPGHVQGSLPADWPRWT